MNFTIKLYCFVTIINFIIMENYFSVTLVWLLTAYWLWFDYYKDSSNERLTPVEKYGCPHCNAEYQSHISECADCNNQLVFYSKESIK